MLVLVFKTSEVRNPSMTQAQWRNNVAVKLAEIIGVPFDRLTPPEYHLNEAQRMGLRTGKKCLESMDQKTPGKPTEEPR